MRSNDFGFTNIKANSDYDKLVNFINFFNSQLNILEKAKPNQANIYQKLKASYNSDQLIKKLKSFQKKLNRSIEMGQIDHLGPFLINELLKDLILVTFDKDLLHVRPQIIHVIQILSHCIATLDFVEQGILDAYKDSSILGKAITEILEIRKASEEAKVEINEEKEKIYQKNLEEVYGAERITVIDENLNALEKALFLDQKELSEKTTKITNDLKTVTQQLQNSPIAILEKQIAKFKHVSNNAMKVEQRWVRFTEPRCDEVDPSYSCRSHCVHSGERYEDFEVEDKDARDKARKQYEITKKELEKCKRDESLMNGIRQLKNKEKSLLKEIDSFPLSSKKITDMIKKIREMKSLMTPANLEHNQEAYEVISQLTISPKLNLELAQLFVSLKQIDQSNLIQLLIAFQPDSKMMQLFVENIEKLRPNSKFEFLLALSTSYAKEKDVSFLQQIYSQCFWPRINSMLNPEQIAELNKLFLASIQDEALRDKLIKSLGELEEMEFATVEDKLGAFFADIQKQNQVEENGKEEVQENVEADEKQAAKKQAILREVKDLFKDPITLKK